MLLLLIKLTMLAVMVAGVVAVTRQLSQAARGKTLVQAKPTTAAASEGEEAA
ncbi:MAG: hypothetical protein LCH85_05805 [Chloroflexi bacterium]|nr:hypothetical protein [Chloroflexota bacterium]